MSEIDFYDIKKRGMFYIEVEACTNLLELSENFISKDDLKILTGENNLYDTRYYLAAEIREACLEWADLIPEKSISTTQTNRKIRTLMSELPPHKIRNYVQNGFTIRGDRIINEQRKAERGRELLEQEKERRRLAHEARMAAPYERVDYCTMNDRRNIVTAMDDIVLKKYKVTFRQDYYGENIVSLIAFFKRLTSWEEVAKWHRSQNKRKKYSQDLPYMKKIWDDPTILTTQEVM